MTDVRAARVLLVAIGWWAIAATIVGAGCRGGSSDPAAPATIGGGDVPVVVSARVVCRLIADNESARAGSITGSDGTQSAAVDGRGYWFFGDTVRTGPGGRADVIPAAVATTTDFDGSDCIDLEFKTAAGIVQPMFPRLDETTAWPDGVLALDDGSILFYMVKAYRQSPFAWHVGAVGLGRIPPNSTTGARVAETIWDDASGFGARVGGVRSPILVGGDVIAYLRTDAGQNFVVRAPLDRIDRNDAYTYWDGAGWTPDEARAKPMWEDEPSTLPADNGVQVTRDAASGKWLAISNSRLASISARTADQPWGPWSAPAQWIDCRRFVEDVYPYCYTAELHPELDRDGGRTRYVTVSSQKPYDVWLLELRFGAAIHGWRATDGTMRYAVSQPEGAYSDTGIAFYAATTPEEGLVPVFERELDGGLTYSLGEPSGGGTPAFYVHRDSTQGIVPVVPVYRWQRDGHEALSTVALDGWTRGSISFYAPCTGSAELSFCGE